MIDRGFNESYIPVEINAGNGTQGIFIDQGVIKVHDPLSGGFYGMAFRLFLPFSAFPNPHPPEFLRWLGFLDVQV